MKIRKFLLITMPLILTAVLLFAALTDVSANLDQDQEKVKMLQARLEKVEQQLEENRTKWRDAELMKYQDTVFRKQYPVFSRIVDVVYRKSREYRFDPNLVMSVILVESDFNPRAVSSRGAYGLMQVNVAVWKDELDIDSGRIFDIEYNIDLGLKILRRYFKIAKGDILQALHYYNNGFLFNNQKYKLKVTNTVFY
jgi:soluble lytic murein transglycosylase-like protein